MVKTKVAIKKKKTIISSEVHIGDKHLNYCKNESHAPKNSYGFKVNDKNGEDKTKGTK